MFIQRFDSSKLEDAYGILCQRIYSNALGAATDEKAPPPFGSTYCEIPPKGSTAPHEHYDGETFLILEGQGVMRIGEEESAVATGDVILIPNHTNHVLTNGSDSQSLRFVSIYWENRGRAYDDAKPARMFLASAPPTPNGPLHLGHLSGPYVVADILRRFYRLQGTEVAYVCGSDDNQSYVPSKGLKLGLTAQGVLDRFVPEITGVQERIGAKPDYFLRPHGNEAYVAFVQSFFTRLVKNGNLKLRPSQVLYCETCHMHLHEAFVKGGCPSCELPTSGNGCEACGLTNDCIDLKDPRCAQCDSVPVSQAMDKFYFPLGTWKDRLKAYFDKTAIPAPFQAFAYSLLDKGMRDISATHPSPWGIPVPAAVATDATRGQVIYEWFEMAAGYVFMAEQLSEGKGYAHFLADPGSRFVQCYGFDNSYFYLAFVPALLMAFDEKIAPPDAFAINFFYLLEGKKFSTSRNHAVWGKEFLEHVHPDVARYYLAATRSEEGETNFSLDECEARVRHILEAKWNGLAKKLDKLTELHGGTMPAAAKSLNPSQLAFVRRGEDALAQAAYYYRVESFSMNRLVGLLDRFVEDISIRADHALSISGHPALAARFATGSALVLSAARLLGAMVYPLMPETGSAWFEKWENARPTQWPTHFGVIAAGTTAATHPLFTDRFEKALLGIQTLKAIRA